MSIKIEISTGELLDKISILLIKSERIKDKDKLINIGNELHILQTAWQASPYSGMEGMAEDLQALREVNEALWDIEDAIREKERAEEFDDRFIALARSVYITNDRRAGIKKRINLRSGSGLIEEKSYSGYQIES